MIETSNGRLRLRCDVDGCPRVFTPRAPTVQTIASLIDRAELAGWRLPDRVVLSSSTDAPRAVADIHGEPDRCPEHAS